MRTLLHRINNYEIGATAMRRFNFTCSLVFLALIYPSMTVWKDSVPYLVGLSVWANFAGHLSAWQASRIERKQEKQDE